MERIIDPRDYDLEDEKTMKLKAALWLEVNAVFEEKKLFPWKGSLRIKSGYPEEVKQRIRNAVVSIATLFLTKEAYVTKDEFIVPASWWDHFKDRWFPRWGWVKRWFPIKQKKLPYQTAYYRVCPHLDIPANKDPVSRHAHISWLDSRQRGDSSRTSIRRSDDES